MTLPTSPDTPPAPTSTLACAVLVLRLALEDGEAAVREIRAALAAPDHVNFVLGTVAVAEPSLAHALDLVRAARTVLLARGEGR